MSTNEVLSKKPQHIYIFEECRNK